MTGEDIIALWSDVRSLIRLAFPEFRGSSPRTEPQGYSIFRGCFLWPIGTMSLGRGPSSRCLAYHGSCRDEPSGPLHTVPSIRRRVGIRSRLGGRLRPCARRRKGRSGKSARLRDTCRDCTSLPDRSIKPQAANHRAATFICVQGWKNPQDAGEERGREDGITLVVTPWAWLVALLA